MELNKVNPEKVYEKANVDNVSSEKKNFWMLMATSVLTFLITSFVFIGIKILNPESQVKFNVGEAAYANVQKFNEAREVLKTKYYQDISDDKLLEGAIAGMASSTEDPYTVYFTKDQMKIFDEKSEGSYYGIGISIRPDEKGILTVIDTFEDSPAREKGILPGDKIVKVDDTDVTTIKDEEIIIKMIKGVENTNVKINIYRTSEQQFYDYIVARKRIKVLNIKSEFLKGDIGYIKLSMFDGDISKDFDKKLSELTAKGMKGLIIDVRDNPGGSYQEVVKICDRLLPKALIVYTENKEGRQFEEYSDEEHFSMPLVVLMNEYSASASEILAGALKDNKKATLIGTKSYGKGLVQTIHRFSDNTGMKFTISRYFTPSGVCIDKVGIKPDIDVSPTQKYKEKPVSQIPKAEDVQLIKAEEILGSQIRK